MSTKVWDITQPKDNWERRYASIAFSFLQIRTAYDTKIVVQYAEV